MEWLRLQQVTPRHHQVSSEVTAKEEEEEFEKVEDDEEEATAQLNVDIMGRVRLRYTGSPAACDRAYANWAKFVRHSICMDKAKFEKS